MNSPFMPQDVAERWQVLATAGENLQSRELFRFVHSAVQENTHSKEIELALQWAEEMQDRDPDSDTFGNFRWYRRNAKPVDLNAVEFCMEVGILVWIDYKASLSTQAKELLERLIQLSIEGIHRHQPRVSYTNIYLMKMWNCIGIGEGLPSNKLAEEGYAMLDLWLEEVAQNGIHEYVSPTYTPVCMECLENIARYTSHSEIRKKVDDALRFCWLQLAANWFPNCERLVGAHSRDYDYLGTGIRNARVRNRMNTLLSDDMQVSGSGREGRGVYLPGGSVGEDVRGMIQDVPRVVCQKWGVESYETATTYVGKSFAIGSAGAAYGPIDKCLTVHLGDKDTTNMTFFCDARGDHYGQRQFELDAGHSKALHLVPFLASVQRGAEVLFLAAPEPKGRHFRRSAPNPTCLLSHLIFPLGCEVYFGDTLTAVETGFVQTVSCHTPIILKYEDVAIGIRFLLAKAEDGTDAQINFVCDEEGAGFGAMRVTCTHAGGSPQSGGVLGFWVGCKEDLNQDSFGDFVAHFEQEIDACLDHQVATLGVSGWESEMRLKVDLESQERLVVSGGEGDNSDALFAVNGHDIGKCIFDRLGIQ